MEGKSWEIFSEQLAEKSKSTQASYTKALERFCEWLQVDSEGLYQMHLKSEQSIDPRDKGEVARKVRAYMAEQVKKGVSVSLAEQCKKAVTFFMRENGFESFTIKQKNGYVFHEGSRIVTAAEIREMVTQNPDPRKVALSLFLKDSGLRIGDAIQINYGQLRNALESDERFVLFEIRQIKTKRPAKTIVGFEALDALRAYIEYRKRGGEIITPQSPLFIDKESGERLGRGAASELLRRISKKGKFTKVSAHSLRKFTITNLQIGKMNPLFVSLVIGKVMEGTWGSYTLPSDAELLNQYKVAYKQLAVLTNYERAEAQEAQIKQLEEQVKGLYRILNDPNDKRIYQHLNDIDKE